MANKFLHLRSGVAGVAPTPAQIEVGQIAMNYNDEYLFILNSAGEVVVIASATAIERSNNSVLSVNTKTPNASGAVTISPGDIGQYGVAYLDLNSKIPTSLLPDSVLGAVTYQGTWDASTNTPTLPDPTTTKGHYYVVETPGTYLGIPYTVGDWVISNGTAWQKVDALDGVTSVAGKTGVVVLAAGDIASGIFTSARLGTSSGNDMILTTDASGNPTWVPKATYAGTVTSVGMTVPGTLLAVSGSPITGSGTLAVTLPVRAANLVFAGPASGANAAPAFRSLVAADVPTLDEGTF